MDFLPPSINAYVEAHTQAESDLLKELNRETHAKIMMPRMLSGHLQGRVLSMFSHMIKPKCVLEIGTYTGYSALCLSEGLVVGGKLHTIDVNEELEGFVRSFFKKAGVEDKIIYHLGDAGEIIPTIKDQLDIVFIDADKENYLNYYKLVFDQVRSGGYIIADNVLWSGKVIEPYEKLDKDTRALMDYNTFVLNDDRVENVLLPVRDGLMVARKK